MEPINENSVRVAAWGRVGLALILTLMSQPLILLVFGKLYCFRPRFLDLDLGATD